MANPENKQIPYESTQKDIRDAIESVATAIGGIAIPSADHVSYDNSVSGLSATDVQNALDEIVSDIPTVNNGTLTIQQNGTSIGSFSANTASNVTANIKTPTADKKTATDQFNTADGGLLSKCQINLVPVQSGSGDPSPDNVRPISGHTEVDLQVDGKNLLPLTLDTIKSRNTAGTWSGNVYTIGNLKFEVLLDNYRNVIGIKANGSHTSNVSFGLYNDTFENGTYYFNGISGGSTTTYLLYSPQGGELYDGDKGLNVNSNTLSLTFAIRANVTISNLIVYPMIRLSTETDSTFEPYLGHLYQVQIGSTVYGGTVDLVSGVMTADIAIVDLGSLSWGYNSTNNFFYASVSGMKYKTSKLYASIYKSTSPKLPSAMATADNNTICARDYNGEQIQVKDTRYTDYSAYTTAVTGEKLCYELDTPITINLTPQQIETLADQNNLSTPLSGQSIETNGVEYKELFTFADVKEIVNLRVPISMLGTDESGRTTASQSYASGDYFYKDGYMCKALTSISAGATLTLNTNYSQGTLADILKAIENA